MITETHSMTASTIIDSTAFDFVPATKTFAADMSDLTETGSKFCKINHMGAVGFGIRSAKTGNIQIFRHVETKTDGEGDIQFWKFRSMQDATLTAVLFND